MSVKTSRECCCVPHCTAARYKCPVLSFHSFPKNDERKKKWIAKIRRDEGATFEITKNTKVCGRHFLAADFLPFSGDGIGEAKQLKPEAVPVIFEWTNWLPPKRRKSPVKRDPLSPGKRCTPTPDDTEGGKPPEKAIELDLDALQTRVQELEEELKQAQETNKQLAVQAKISRFCLERFSSDDSKIQYYTGFSTYSTFKGFFTFIEPYAGTMVQSYGRTESKLFTKRLSGSMPLIDEMFMFFVRLKLGLQIIDLADRFSLSRSSVSTKIQNWANFLYTILSSMNFWLSRDEVNEWMPACFKEKQYSATRVIIDCTEIYVQRPSSLVRNTQFYSTYKGHSTMKSLIGISPHGTVTFVSSLYTGSMSDIEITKQSGLLELLEPGDSVMCDKGFNIAALLRERKVGINMPAFLCRGQFTPEEVQENRRISSLRVHVERAIRRVKEYGFFQGVLPLSMCGTLNQMWTVAVLMTNFKPPLVGKFDPRPSTSIE